MNFLKSFPDKDELLNWVVNHDNDSVLNVNGHIHTPYSFSSFDSIEQAFDMAVKENVKVLGINDFFVTDGYKVFHDIALCKKVFPLFNIEFIGLIKEAQKNGIRINDPNNPGRIYFSGKGLTYPLTINAQNKKLIDSVIAESQLQVKAMIEKANQWFVHNKIEIELNYDKIQSLYAMNLVRERHIAKAIRIEFANKFQNEDNCLEAYSKAFNGKQLKSNLNDFSGLENEIRGNLLKSGGPAFVEETEDSFLDIHVLINIIKNAGGIPCYPVLLDDTNGKITDFEADFEKLFQELSKLGISCIELIPNRNDSEILKKFVTFFDKKGFLVLFGTEHNTPDLIPLTVVTRGNKPLDTDLQKISYKNTCVVAAHQYLLAKGFDGFNDIKSRTELIELENLGNAIIKWFQK